MKKDDWTGYELDYLNELNMKIGKLEKQLELIKQDSQKDKQKYPKIIGSIECVSETHWHYC